MNGLQESPDELLLSAQSSGEGAMYTGRQIITFREGAVESGLAALESGDSRVAHSAEFVEGVLDFNEVGDAGMIVFDELGIAVVSAGTPFMEMSAAQDVSTADGPIQAIEPEIFMFALGDHRDSFLAGFSAAVERLKQEFGKDPSGHLGRTSESLSEALATWGLVATRADQSKYSGEGIKIAILDTGFDFYHPDFIGRTIVQASFVAGQMAQDVHGHGTHCTGTACGTRSPVGVQRYGVAHESLIHIGKVLSNSGSGTSAGILAGMNWAVANRCEVISMSLGGGGGPYTYYTEAGRRALATNCLVIAAAGNLSARPGQIAPTMAPANSPTIMSVAALDERLGVAGFSCGGKIDIAAPGVSIFSSLPLPRRHASWNGTSMATPHVAGVAALWAQSDASLRGQTLRAKLENTVRRLTLPPADVGAGLVQAP